MQCFPDLLLTPYGVPLLHHLRLNKSMCLNFGIGSSVPLVVVGWEGKRGGWPRRAGEGAEGMGVAVGVGLDDS